MRCPGAQHSGLLGQWALWHTECKDFSLDRPATLSLALFQMNLTLNQSGFAA